MIFLPFLKTVLSENKSEANIPAFEIPGNLYFVGCILAQEQTQHICFKKCKVNIKVYFLKKNKTFPMPCESMFERGKYD